MEMAKNPVSSWSTAIGAIGDALRAPALFPGISALLFGIYALQMILAPRLESPETTATEMFAILALVIVSSLAIIPLAIPIMRVYAGGTFTVTPRIVLRMIGYGLAVCAMFGVLMFLVGGALFGIAMVAEFEGISIVHWIVLLIFFPLTWLVFRLTTLWPALALDEPGPVFRRSFGETKGYVGYFLLTTFFVFVIILIPILIAVLIIAFAGPFVFDPTQEDNFGMKLVFGAINSLVGVFSIMYTCTLYGRFFRTVRGI
jgi:hypothetical protein